eukprot:COSAG02_NODE_424_length_22575_cov_79.088361_6_plen_112_part_00
MSPAHMQTNIARTSVSPAHMQTNNPSILWPNAHSSAFTPPPPQTKPESVVVVCAQMEVLTCFRHMGQMRFSAKFLRLYLWRCRVRSDLRALDSALGAAGKLSLKRTPPSTL